MINAEFHSLTVSNICQETESSVCVSFDVPAQLSDVFSFKPGQYLTMRHVIDGEELRRSYSICSGLDDGTLKVGIKHIEEGAFSGFANTALKAGDELDVMPPQGEFSVNVDADHAKQYMCICVGSGVTPILSIVKSILTHEPNSKVTLLYGNKTSASVMFRDELGALKNKHMSRFNWLNILSREEQDAEVLYGRLDNSKGGELSQKGLIDIAGSDEFFLCGPESMISEVSRGLRAFGVDEQHINYELFFASAEDAKEVVAKHHARAEQYAGQVSQVTVKVNGRSINFDLTADGENILDGAMRNGADLPFSCKGGVCATCKARVLDGEVDMDLNHALSDSEVADGMVLTCQAHPISASVTVDFDQI